MKYKRTTLNIRYKKQKINNTRKHPVNTRKHSRKHPVKPRKHSRKTSRKTRKNIKGGFTFSNFSNFSNYFNFSKFYKYFNSNTKEPIAEQAFLDFQLIWYIDEIFETHFKSISAAPMFIDTKQIFTNDIARKQYEQRIQYQIQESNKTEQVKDEFSKKYPNYIKHIKQLKMYMSYDKTIYNILLNINKKEVINVSVDMLELYEINKNVVIPRITELINILFYRITENVNNNTDDNKKLFNQIYNKLNKHFKENKILKLKGDDDDNYTQYKTEMNNLKNNIDILYGCINDLINSDDNQNLICERITNKNDFIEKPIEQTVVEDPSNDR